MNSSFPKVLNNFFAETNLLHFSLNQQTYLGGIVGLTSILLGNVRG